MTNLSDAYLDEQVFLLIGQNESLSRKLAGRVFSLLGITIAEYTLLRILDNTPRITASEVGRRLSSSAPSVTQFVKSLERKLLISRSADTKDIRRQPILLTKKGKSVIRRARNGIQTELSKLKIPRNILLLLRDHLLLISSSLSSYGD